MRNIFDISKLSDEQLLQLNHEIIAMVQTRQRQQERQKMLLFDVGDLVSFEGPEGGLIRGTILRVNKKSITIATSKGTWRIDASFISKEKQCAKTKNANEISSAIKNNLRIIKNYTSRNSPQ